MNTISDTCTSAPAPASYTPTQDDLTQLHTVGAIHDLLDVARDLPPELRWGLLDYAAAVLEGEGRVPSAADRAA